jgi:hypothetical protein
VLLTILLSHIIEIFRTATILGYKLLLLIYLFNYLNYRKENEGLRRSANKAGNRIECALILRLLSTWMSSSSNKSSTIVIIVVVTVCDC